jgi:hypothetical protein
MTVRELIAALKEYPGDVEVQVYDDSLLRAPDPRLEKLKQFKKADKTTVTL